jgi:hypothetical protein
MHTLTVSQTASALARLERLHTMLTLDEAIEVVTGKKPPLVQRMRKKTTNLWRDVGYAAAAPIRKTEDAIAGEWMIPESALELLLRRCRRVGYIKELGMEVPYYELPSGGIRLIAADIRAVLKCEPPLQFPDCMNELRRGLARLQEDQIDEGR